MKLRSMGSALALSLLLALGAGCVRGGSMGGDVEQVHRTLQLGPTPTIVLKNTNGEAHVEAWERDDVEIDAVKSARGDDCVKVDIFTTGNRVEINSERRGELHIGVFRECSVDYTIHAPRGATLRLKTVNGEVTVKGGGVDVVAETVNGHVSAEDVSGLLELRSVNGGVDARLSKPGARVKLETVNGAVNLSLPSPLDAQVDAQTVNGGLSNDFDLNVNRPQHGPGGSIHQNVGAGRSHIELKTVNGGVELHKL